MLFWTGGQLGISATRQLGCNQGTENGQHRTGVGTRPMMSGLGRNREWGEMLSEGREAKFEIPGRRRTGKRPDKASQLVKPAGW